MKILSLESVLNQGDAYSGGHLIEVQWSLHNSNDQGEKEIVPVMETFEVEKI